MTFIPPPLFSLVFRDITKSLKDAGSGLTDVERIHVVIHRSIANGIRNKRQICAMAKAFDLNTRRVGAIIDDHTGSDPSPKKLWYLDREGRYWLHG